MKPGFRPNVVAVIQNSEGLILVGRGPKQNRGTWQCPQGGIKRGETPEEALHREIEEEIGVEDLRILKQSFGEICYEWPLEVLNKKKNNYIGQVQIYFLLAAPKNLFKQLKKTKDFHDYKWALPGDVVKMVVHFKQSAYEQGLGELGLLL